MPFPPAVARPAAPSGTRGRHRLPEPLRAVLRSGPLGALEEVSAWLPARPRVTMERWVEATRVARAALRPRPVWRLTGTARADGRRLRVVTDLGRDGLEYWRDLLFAGPPHQVHLGTFRTPWRRAADLDGDLELFRHHRVLRPVLHRLGHLSLPSWADTGLPLPGDGSTGLASRPGSLSRRSDLRRIARAGLTPLLTSDRGAIAHFLREWYLPYVSGRWGDGLVALDPGWMRRAPRFCELLWVMQGREPVAGVLLEPRGATLRMVAIGVIDERWRRAGALAACYRFTIVEAAARGCRLVRMGGTRPVLSDGLLAFKRKWGAGVRRTRQWDYLGLRCPDWPATLRATFTAHPVLVETPRAGFRALLDPAALRGPGAERLHAMLALPGLHGVVAPDAAGGWRLAGLPAGSD